jgi:hypothetical protein
MTTIYTVGDMRKAIADLPDDMPIHRRGCGVHCPHGWTIGIVMLAEHKTDNGYFAAVGPKDFWGARKYRGQFNKPFRALYTFA